MRRADPGAIWRARAPLCLRRAADEKPEGARRNPPAFRGDCMAKVIDIATRKPIRAKRKRKRGAAPCPDVLAKIREYMELAEAGEISSVCIVAVGPDVLHYTGSSCEGFEALSMIAGLRIVAAEMERDTIGDA